MRLLLILFILTTLVSCGQKKGSTNTSFKLTMAALGKPSGFSGGLVIYGKSMSGPHQFTKVLESQLTQDYEIPNGMWNFFAIGWDGTDLMTGKVFCANVMNVDLSGDPRNIDLEVTNANCQKQVFGRTVASTNGLRFPELKIETCNKLDPAIPSCNYNPDFNNYTNDKGYIASYHVEIRSFFKEGTVINQLPGKLVSSCVNVNSLTNGLDVNLKFSALNLAPGLKNIETPFSMVLKGYYKEDCNISRGIKEFIMPTGTLSSSDQIAGNYFDSSGLKVRINTLTTLEEVCNDLVRTKKTDYAAGRGTIAHPFVICTPKQFSRISNIDFNKNFILGKDLDFAAESAILKTFNDLACTQLGDNFVPVSGYDNTDLTIPDPIPCQSFDNLQSFSKTFDGQNFKIKNLRLENGQLNTIGLFRNIRNGSVQNLIIDNATIEGSHTIGLVVGKCNGCSIKNIKVYNSKIRSNTQTTDAHSGLIAGIVENDGSIQNAYVYDSKIRAESAKVGAIVGKITGTNVADSKILDSVVYNVKVEGTQFVGGIAGAILTSTAKRVGFSGLVESQEGSDPHGVKVGGVVGLLSGASILEHTYSNAYIKMNHELNKVVAGGIVGKSDGNGNVSFAYSAGKIEHRCSNGTPANCKVGNICGDGCVPTFCNNGNKCFFDNNDSNLGFGGFPNVVSALTLNDMLSSTETLATDLEDGASDFWTQTNGMLPRFNHEPESACMNDLDLESINNQLSSGRGSLENPIRICSFSQLLTVSGKNSHFRIESPLKLGTQNAASILSLDGVLDGNHKILYGLELEGADNKDSALITSTSANSVIKNINIVDAKLASFDPNKKSSILIGIHNGIAENIKISANVKSATDLSNNTADSALNNFGIFSSINNGVISNIDIDGSVKAMRKIGGVSSENTSSGKISKCDVDVKFLLDDDLDSEIGSIAAINNGIIEKCRSSSYFEKFTAYNVPQNAIILGGLVGVNQLSGVIKDSHFGEEELNHPSEILVDTSTGSISIGGITGVNSGDIENTYVNANIELIDPINSTLAFGIVGEDNGGQITNAFVHGRVHYKFAPAITNFNCNNGKAEVTFTTAVSDGLEVKVGDLLTIEENDGTISTISVDQQVFLVGDNLTANVITLSSCYTTVPTIANIINVFLEKHNDLGDSLLTTEVFNHVTYCPELDTLATDAPFFKCSDGFDIVSFGNDTVPTFGSARMINTFKKMLGLPASNDLPPVWEINLNNNNPRLPNLFRIDHD